MKSFLCLVSMLAATMTVAAADPIEERKENMKERGALMRVLGPIAQERAPFDAAAVFDALESLNENAQAAADVASLWPAGTETGDTDSAPRIWEDLEGYQAASDRYAADVAAALAANPQDLPSFQAVFQPVAANCGACHEPYRL